MEQVRYATLARISSPKQDLSSQVSEIRRYCKANLAEKYVQITHKEEIISTLKNWRKRKDGFMEILNLAKANKIDYVIMYSVYRLGRTPYENYEMAKALNECGVQLYFVRDNVYVGDGESPMDKMFFAMLSCQAEAERDIKVDRGQRGYKNWRKNYPDKIWGQQPKIRGKKLELFIAMYNAKKPISRAWDKRRQPDESGETFKFSYREIGEAMGINKSTVGRYVKRLINAGQVEPRTKEDGERYKKMDYISEEARMHAERTAIKPKRPEFVDIEIDDKGTTGTIARETAMYDEDGNLHPAYADDTLGPFSKATKAIEEELDSFKFTTYIQ